jgi:peptide/nickel transport system substrate-binding protein
MDLQDEFDLSYLFISHNLSVIKHLAHDVAVIYKGAIVEQGPADQVLGDPQHEYTRRLLAAVPRTPPDVTSSGGGDFSVGAKTTPPPVEPPAEPPAAPPGSSSAPPPMRDASGRRSAIRVAAALAVIALLVVGGVFFIRFGTNPHSAAASGDAEVGSGSDINARDPASLREGGNLKLSISEFPVNFNQLHIDGNTADTGAILRPTLPRAFVVRPDGSKTLDTNYFTKAEITKTDPQVVTYTINPEAVWSDGSPITWEDIKAMANAQSGRDDRYKIAAPAGFERVASVTRGVDDRQAVMTFEKPFSEWQGMLSGLLPKSMTSTPEAFNTAQMNAPGPSAGPFVVSAIDKGAQRIVLTRNPKWWGNTPRLDSITWIVLDTAADMPALQNNAIDAVGISSLDDMTIAQRTSGVSIRHAPAPSWSHLTFNGAPGSILADPKLRVAIMRAIDRQGIANVSQRGLAANPKPLNNHVFVAGQEGYQNNSEVAKFDPDQARRDLDELGWRFNGPVRRRDGRPLTVRLVIFDSLPTRQIAQIVRSNLTAVGIDVVLDQKSGGKFFTDYIIPGDFDIAFFGWAGDAYPLTGLTQIYKSTGESNFGKIGTPAIDAKIDETLSELDADKARQLANDVDKMLWQEGFSLPLTQSPGNVAVRSNLANYGAAGLGSYDYTAIGFMK